ncbi:hypothetical protein U9M48_038670 [Paspalum notatum var. saurae]|uniref:Uncharacterized protein n=1 Tax=Paspalum notatum var. saurae TaxID=547442 RepID=A0AAQ3XCA5_PASNO
MLHPSNMKNNKRNMCGVLMFTLFLFAFVAQGRPHKQQQLHVVGTPRRGQQQVYHSLTNATVDDERKVVLKFCTTNTCKGFTTCYCCLNLKPHPKCYVTLTQCQAVCPTCNPKCPPVYSLAG